MFIFAKNTKEKIVTAWTVIACGLLPILEIRRIYFIIWPTATFAPSFGFPDIFLILLFVVPIAVLTGFKWGYKFARFIFGTIAYLALFGSTEPDAWLYDKHLLFFVGEALLISAFAAFLVYCLGQHAKLRNIYPAQNESWQSSRSKNPWIIGGVIVAICGMLGGPLKLALLIGMDRVKQSKDLHNIQQCGEAFSHYAMEHDGEFPTTNTTSTDLFNYLTNGNYVTDPRIICGSGAYCLSSGGSLTSNNVAWSCAQGLKTKDNPGYALLWSKGTIPYVTNGNLIIDTANNYWGSKGKPFAAIYYLNGSASSPRFPWFGDSLVATNRLSGPSANVYTNYLNP